MPKFLAPNHQSAHRIAAIALYRALLTQARAVPLPSIRQTEIQNLIRSRFKQWRNQQSTKRLHVAFVGGYEALDKLDAAVAGCHETINYITDLLSRVEDRWKRPLKTRRVRVRQDLKEWPRSNVLDRPRPLYELSGRRHAPRLVNARGIPFLRIKKPQPLKLTGYLARRQKKQQQRTDLRDRLQATLKFAAAEDHWDSLIAAQTGESEEDDRSGQWKAATEASLHAVKQYTHAEQAKYRTMAARLQHIVDQERALIQTERAARRRVAVELKKKSEDHSQDRSTIEQDKR